jgi:hypothetical protein
VDFSKDLTTRCGRKRRDEQIAPSSGLYGLTHILITETQYTELVAVVILLCPMTDSRIRSIKTPMQGCIPVESGLRHQLRSRFTKHLVGSSR